MQALSIRGTSSRLIMGRHAGAHRFCLYRRMRSNVKWSAMSASQTALLA
jgi:hypothetical protein